MKKISVIIPAMILAICLVFTSCKTENKTENNTESEAGIDTVVSDSTPVLSLVCENKKVAPGEYVRIYLHFTDCEKFAVGSFKFTVDGNVTIDFADRAEELDIYAQTNMESDNVLVAGMFVARTIDLLDDDVFYVDLLVPEDAKAGEKIKIGFSVDEFEVGIDEDGDEIVDVVPEIDVDELTLKVAKS